MQLAQEFDAVERGVPYSSTHRRRLVAPDVRSRVAGYLGTAPIAAPGYRTDGKWVWPERLAERARVDGLAPQEQLYEHLRRAAFLLPPRVADAELARAAAAVAGPPTVDPAPPYEWRHLTNHSGGSTSLLRIRRREDGSAAEFLYQASGWEPVQSEHLDRRQFLEIPGRAAAELNNRLATATHDRLLSRARESEPQWPRLARVFDGESPAGVPWFSPSRLRIPEPDRRERIAAYLGGGRTVLRAGGSMVDPLGGEALIPLSYRTDGEWVWSQWLAHYVLTRGLAPELEFLGHIEGRGYRPVDDVPVEAVPAAGMVIKAGPPPRLFRPPLTYYWEPSGGIARVRGRETETLRDDLRWARTTATLPAAAYREITEADAVAFLDARWEAGGVLPPLD